jgi:arylsulfatase A-like enzyme
MENADSALGRLVDTYKGLGIYDQTVFCFMGDHGVLPLEQQVNTGGFGPAVQTAGTMMVASDYHTGGFIWLEDPSRAINAATAVDGLREPGVSATYFLGSAAGRRQYLPSPASADRVTSQLDGAYRYLLETMNGANAPHVVVLYEERTGTLGAGGPYQWKGDHGGASWAAQGVAMAMAGPGIRQGYRSPFPARVVDLAPTFLRLLGAPRPAMDGVVLADALQSPTSSESTVQNTTSRQLVPVARALQAQSLADVRRMHGPTATSTTGKSKSKRIPLNPNY